MANVVELAVVEAIVAFVVGVAFGVIAMVAAGIRVEEKLARRKNLARQRGVTLYDDADSAMTRSTRWLTTGRDHHS
jgi:membrane protein DedA with SNARE-associated domain